MLKEEFEVAYCERSGISRDAYRERYVTLPCACGVEGCEGWAKVSLEDHSLLHHLAFDLPNQNILLEMETESLRRRGG